MAKKKSKAETKDYMLAVKLTNTVKDLLEKRRIEQGDESISHTVRKILIRELEPAR